MKLSKRSETLLLFIWGVALIATLGSLFYSEIIGYVPCDLCWIQRIFMYPLVIIYGTALIKKEIKIDLSGLILSGIGLCVSIYHYSLQKAPFMKEAGGFCGELPCNLKYLKCCGCISIPFLAGVAFIVIFS